jgi:uncharacterized membrane protein (DUF4010 family)
MTAEYDLFIRFAMALGIGFIIGLQREFSHGRDGRDIIAGERTFALLSMGGCLAAMISDHLESPFILIGILLIFGVFTSIAYFSDAWKRGQVGITSEVAIIIAVLIGVLCYYGDLTTAAAIGITTTVLLSIKLETDRFVRALTREEVFAALQLAVISAIVLPLLPNRSFFDPPFDVLNPFNIWLMVVFISGINFLGYVFMKVVSSDQGITLAGFLGGLVSSTAVSLSFSERSKREAGLAKPLALAITIAWTVMFVRVLIEVGVLNRALLGIVWVPIAAAGAAALLYCAYLYFSRRPTEKSDLALTNPIDLGSAIKFGLLYAFILLVSRAAYLYYGDTGIFVSSILSGLADVDAITLSMSELSNSGALELHTASRAIVLAAMSNTVTKGAIVLMGGSPGLRKAIWPGIVLVLITGVSVGFLV